MLKRRQHGFTPMKSGMENGRIFHYHPFVGVGRWPILRFSLYTTVGTLGVLDPDTTRAISSSFSLDLIKFLLNLETYRVNKAARVSPRQKDKLSPRTSAPANNVH